MHVRSGAPAILQPLLALSVVLVAGSASAGVNRWSITGPPVSVRAMAVDPQDGNILHAVGAGAAARSEDRGASWTVTPLPSLGFPAAIRVAASAPSTVYALGAGALYRSTTGGRTWTAATVPEAAPFRNDLQIDARNSAIVVLACSNLCVFGCSGGGVFRSDDSGASWREIGLKNTNVTQVALDPANANLLYAVSGGKLFRTGDGGRAWREISPPQSGSIESVAVDPVLPSTIYAGTESGVFRSLDSGQTWMRIRDSASGGLVATAAHASRELLASAAGMVLTADQGETWRALSAAASGLHFGSLWQLVISRDAYYMVSDVVGLPGQILAYEIRLPRRRAVRP